MSQYDPTRKTAGFGFEHQASNAIDGCVYLVGAGPGDPSLITVRGYELLARADVVLYDFLVNPLILEPVSEEAEKIFV